MASVLDLLSSKTLSIKAKYLLILSTTEKPLTNKEIKEIAHEHGWRKGGDGNPAASLSNSGDAANTPKGWVLTERGRTSLEQYGVPVSFSLTSPMIAALAQHAARITDPIKRAFLEETVACLRHNELRAALVLSWIGAVSILYEHVINHHLTQFNAEALRRGKLRQAAGTADDLATMREADFLDIIEAIRVVTPSVKKELKNCLGRRNTAGHPNTYQFREPAVADHIDTLLHEVFSKF